MIKSGNCLAATKFLTLLWVLFYNSPLVAQETYRLDGEDWQTLVQYDPDTPQGQIQAVRKAIANEKFSKAVKLADKWLKQYPDHSLTVEARLLRGDAYAARKDYYKALYDYEYVARVYPASEQFWTALEREYEIAQLFGSGTRRKLWGMRILPATGEAEEIYIRIQERAPGSDLGENANLALGEQYFKQKEYVSTTDAYEMFLLNYPRSSHRQEVMLRLIRTDLARFKGPNYDATTLIDAVQRIRQYQRLYPQSASELDMKKLADKAIESLANKALIDARWYTLRGEYISAIYLFERIINDYPDTEAGSQAVKLLAKYRRMTMLPVVESQPQTPPVSSEDQPATAEPAIELQKQDNQP